MTPEQSREEQALGVSRGGLTTKIHLLVEGNGLPLSITVTPGQTHESTQVEPLLEGVSVGGKQGPRRKALRVIAGDKGYDGAPARTAIRQSGARPLVAHKRRADGSYPASAKDFDKDLYRRRNIVERRNGHLKEHRRIATRYEKLAVNFVAMIQLAFVLTFIKTLLSDTA
jgi:transposase